MTISQAVTRAFRKDARGMPWSEAFERASSYLVWLVIWSFMAEGILVAGVMFISWALGDFETRKAGLSLGIALVMGGGAMMTVTTIAVWIKASTDALADHVEQRIGSRLGQRSAEVAPANGNYSPTYAHRQ